MRMRLFPSVILLPAVLSISCDTPSAKHDERGSPRNGEMQSAHDTGVWVIDTFVDELGQTRERQYITNRGVIAGNFSTASIPRAPLNIKFRIFDPNNISLQLFEYSGNTPVKALSPQMYSVSIEDADGVDHTVKAVNYGDKLSFERSDAGMIHGILMKGGRVQFSITGEMNTTSRYQFTIENAKGYDEAFSQLEAK